MTTIKKNGSTPIALENLEPRQLFSATLGTINVIDGGTSPGVFASYTLHGIKDGGEAGVYNWTRAAINPGTYAGNPTPGQTFGAFCIEVDQDLPSSPNIAYTVTDLAALGSAKADQLKELWGRFRSSIGTDNTKAAAFQMAVWEIVSDSGKNLTAGIFKADTTTPTGAAAAAQAQSWLNALTGTGPKANLFALSSPIDQDQLFEVPCTPTTTLKKGMTATIGFWQNKNGQNLIKSFNGASTSKLLAKWLSQTFPNLYGSGSANNLNGKTNADVATLFTKLFNVSGQKLDAQVLAVALAVYGTNSSLGGTAAARYGFTVDAIGTGHRLYNIGSNGAAFGVANNTNMEVLDILDAANDRAVNGVLYNGNTTLRNMANTVFTGINEQGDIA